MAAMNVPQDYHGALPNPIEEMELLLAGAGLSIVQATLRYSFFIHPEAVRARCPYFPDRARMSREHYPSGDRGDRASWKGQDVILGDNARAQMAWAKYTGRPVSRGSGYGVRHIWGHPWDANAFTAGWNLCYMPFWLGMLTEDQHPHPRVVAVIRQVSFDLYFRNDPVCAQPDFVRDPEFAMPADGAEDSVRLLRPMREPRAAQARVVAGTSKGVDRVIEIRKERNQSWTNLQKAARALMGRPHEPFGTPAVASSSKSVVRSMLRESMLTLDELASIFDGRALRKID